MHNSKGIRCTVYTMYMYTYSFLYTYCIQKYIYRLVLLAAACKLGSVSYGVKHMPQILYYTLFCVYLWAYLKKYGRIRTLYLTNNCSTMGNTYFLARSLSNIRKVHYGSKHSSQPLCNVTFACAYNCNSKITGHIWTVYILNDCSTIGDVNFLC